MSDRENKNANEIDTLLKKNNKKKLIVGCVLLIIIVAIIVVAIKYYDKDDNNVRKEYNEHKEKNNETENTEVTDITLNGDIMDIDADRKFMIYDKDPTVEYDEEEPPAKSIKEIDVIIAGKADYAKGKFEGNIKVEGNEFKGDMIGYSSSIGEAENEEQQFIYSITALCANSNGTTPDGVMSIDVNISRDLREIIVYVYKYDNYEPIIIYGKV